MLSYLALSPFDVRHVLQHTGLVVARCGESLAELFLKKDAITIYHCLCFISDILTRTMVQTFKPYSAPIQYRLLGCIVRCTIDTDGVPSHCAFAIPRKDESLLCVHQIKKVYKTCLHRRHIDHSYTSSILTRRLLYVAGPWSPRCFLLRNLGFQYPTTKSI